MKMGVFSVKKWKMGVFCENVDVSLTQVALRIVQYFLFDILLIWGCVGLLAQRTPPAYGPGWHDFVRNAYIRRTVNQPPFCVTRFNATHQLTDPTHYKWENMDPIRPNPIQLTIELAVL